MKRGERNEFVGVAQSPATLVFGEPGFPVGGRGLEVLEGQGPTKEVGGGAERDGARALGRKGVQLV